MPMSIGRRTTIFGNPCGRFGKCEYAKKNNKNARTALLLAPLGMPVVGSRYFRHRGGDLEPVVCVCARAQCTINFSRTYYYYNYPAAVIVFIPSQIHWKPSHETANDH